MCIHPLMHGFQTNNHIYYLR